MNYFLGLNDYCYSFDQYLGSPCTLFLDNGKFFPEGLYFFRFIPLTFTTWNTEGSGALGVDLCDESNLDVGICGLGPNEK